MAERVFLMFDYTSSGLWHPSEDGSARAAGMVDPERLPVSRATKQRLAAWVTAYDELSTREFTSGSGPAPTDAEWEAAEAERIALWLALRREAGPDWEIGLRTGDVIVWEEAELR